MSNNNSLAIDIGGTKIAYAIYSPKLEEVYENILPTSQFFKNHKLKELNTLLEYIKKDVKISSFEKIGVSINCVIKDNKIIKSSLLTDAKNTDLKKIVEKYFTCNIFMSDNDVYSMAKAEMIFGKGRRHNSFLYINLGTGIRVVSIENKHPIRGQSNLAGEISVSNIWIEEIKENKKMDDVLAGKGVMLLAKTLKGKTYTPKEIFEKKEEIKKVYIKYLSQFLIQAIYFFNPSAVIFGGSLTKSSKYWLPDLKKKLIQEVFPLFKIDDIIISKVNNPALKGALIDTNLDL